MRLARVEPADDDAAREGAAVEVRDEARERAERASTCPAPTAPRSTTCSPGSIRSEIAVQHRRAAAVGEAQVVDDRYSHAATTTIATASDEGAAVEPAATPVAAHACAAGRP